MPKARPRALLTMEDMGHGSSGDHGKMDHGQINHSQMNQEKMDHSMMKHEPALMDHSQMNHAGVTDHSQHQAKSDSTPQQQMDHSTHVAAKPTVDDQEQPVYGWANASTPAGHKALQYSDLKSLTPQKDTRPAERELEVRLGGTMERYIWTINGKKFTEVEPLQVKYGERIRLKFINDSMMAHPMHLHGMFMQLENGQSSSDMPNKHTLIVPPGKTVTALLTADELGEWAIHCHLLYHMSSGMMSKMIVANVDGNQAATAPSSPSSAKQGDSHAQH
jgi:FtsP/CotA-like multicopper oxidase with cupredoxin domain